MLLLEAGPNFARENADNARCFALLSEIKDSSPPRMELLVPSLVLTLAMLAVYTAGAAPLLETALCASVAMVALGVLTQAEAREAVSWEIYVTIAAAFGIGTAMVNSGVAGGVASFLVAVGEGLGGSTGLFATVYFATVMISNVVTNNAAAALIFPIAMDAAEQGGVNLKNMAFCIMLAASASFMTPFGYQTNLMVYGPGNYRTLDFLRFGTPLQLSCWGLSVAMLGVGDSQGTGAVFSFWGGCAVALALAVCAQAAAFQRHRPRPGSPGQQPLMARGVGLVTADPSGGGGGGGAYRDGLEQSAHAPGEAALQSPEVTAVMPPSKAAALEGTF